MRMRDKVTNQLRKAVVLVGLGTMLMIAAAFAQSQVVSAPQTIEHLTIGATSTIHSTGIGSGAYAAPEIDNNAGGDVGFKGAAALATGAAALAPPRRANMPIPSKEAARQLLASRASTANSVNVETPTLTLSEPVVHSDFVVPFQSFGFAGYNGLSHIDQRTANSGNQYSLEPPDQGLCAGNGYVVETVNNVIRVFDTGGNPLTGVEDMNSFFGLAPEIDRVHGIAGPFLSDPRCYYDHDTQRWFVSELWQDTGTNVGATGRFFNLIAVSQTSHPTGAFAVFYYDVTDDGNDGTPAHAGCPCFGDQPLLGADKFGIYQTTNEFGATVFNGAQIYAFSKPEIVAAANGGPVPALVHIDASLLLSPFAGCPPGPPTFCLSYSIQPATSPSKDADSGVPGGVEYFLSALQFVDTFDNRIAVWALTNTKSLKSRTPNVNLLFDVIRSETYGAPNPAVQKAGEIPLGNFLPTVLLPHTPNTEGLLNTNDDRMNQVVFANGILYGGVNSVVSVGGATHQGLAWFGVKPFFVGPTLHGHVAKQGYVAIAGEDVLFPSIGVNDDGDGVIAFTLAGAGYFPSAAYVDVVDGFALPFVHVAGAGKDPDDGFTIYPQEGGNGVGRWGDYSAAVADGDRIWFAAEYIPSQCSGLVLPCRTELANWGTFFATVKPF
ncbi:MAG: hypothetical protein ACHP78_12955 [Terriglobales bacterium]